VVPESHKWQPLNIAYVNIHDWEPKLFTVEEEATALADLKAVYPGEKLITGFKGSVININSALCGSNKSGKRRRVLNPSYTRSDLPQQLVQRKPLINELYERMLNLHRFFLDIEKRQEILVNLF
jgi:ectoine hydroxylase-related dioxygenase (phytanoyl-CoA dioxygenase family)